jgi:serine/threonine protein kinase
MSRPDVEQQDELVASLLVAYDEALVGEALRPDVESLVDDRALAARLRDARECLELLDRVRRLESQTATSPATRDFETPSINDRTRASHPERIGRFEIVRELGRGGLGVVLLGRDPELGRYVAIKIPRADLLAGGELERRFLREAEAAARLSHPHLVPLYEVGRDGPLCYLVSEYCTGPTLAAWLKAQRGSLSPQQAATLVRQLADAVHHAHSRGVLHRDIKPSNVMLDRLEAGDGRPEERLEDSRDILQPPASRLQPAAKLTDFGMAKILESAGDETRSGAVIGTPAYMAPEQADGRMREIDARADVYALGAVLYELLTGQAPYRGASDVDMLRQLLLEEPAAPRAIRPGVPRDLEAIALKCLA